jgi:type I restriction enzyme S subunit
VTINRVPFEAALLDITGGNRKLLSSEYQNAGAIPVIDQGQAMIAGFTDDLSAICCREGPVILFGDHTRTFKYVDFDFVLGADGVKVLKPLPGFDPRFLFHFLSTVRLPKDLGYSRHFKFLKECSVPKIDLPEQQRIAAILDKADSVRRKRQEAIRLADDFLRAVFIDMFGGRSKTKVLTDYCEFLAGFAFKSEQYVQPADGVRLLRGINVGIGSFDWSDAAGYPANSTTGLDRYRLDPGDVVMAMDRPWISSGLKCAIVDNMVAGSLLVQRVARLRPKRPEHEMFIFNCLQGKDFKNHCRITETTIPHISPKDFATFPVTTANEDELRTFSGIADKVRSIMEKAVVACNSADQLQASLQDSIFTLN